MNKIDTKLDDKTCIERLTQRGAKMQILFAYIKSINPEVFGLVYPKEFDTWFDKNGLTLND